MIYCPGCGTANREGSRFCNECGRRLADESWANCPRCGAANVADAAHCQRCGLDLAHAAGEAPPRGAAPTQGGAEQANLQRGGLPPWLDSVEQPEEEPSTRERGLAAPTSDSFESHPVQDEWSADALSIEPIVGVPYRAHERVTLPPTAEQRAAAGLFAETAAEEVHASPQDVAEDEARPALARGWRLFIAIALLVALAAPLVAPMTALSAVTRIPPGVAAANKAINSLPAGAAVLVVFDYDAGLSGDLTPIADAYLRYLLQRNLHVLAISTLPEGAALADAALDRALQGQPQAVYGEAVLNLGYVAGGEAAVRALAVSIPTVAPNDYRLGRPVSGYPLMAGVTGARDVAMIVVLGRDLTAVQRWIEQVGAPYGTPLLVGVPAMIEPAVSPYQAAGQVRGVVAGLAGAAAYERLQGHSGLGGQLLASLRVGIWTVVGVVVIANLVGLVKRKRNA